MEQSATGRLLAFDPAAGGLLVVASGLSLANGIAPSEDGQSLPVSESGRYCVWRIDVSSQGVNLKPGGEGARILLDNLPGYPDNLMRGRYGRIWLIWPGPRNASDAVGSPPFLRELALRLPRRLLPRPASYGHVLAFRDDATIVEDLQDPSGRAPVITGLTETAGRRYLQSVDDGAISWLAN